MTIDPVARLTRCLLDARIGAGAGMMVAAPDFRNEMKVVQQAFAAFQAECDERDDAMQVIADEPSRDSWLVDREGDLWRAHEPGGWVVVRELKRVSSTSPGRSWADVVDAYGPIKVLTQYAVAGEET